MRLPLSALLVLLSTLLGYARGRVQGIATRGTNLDAATFRLLQFGNNNETQEENLGSGLVDETQAERPPNATEPSNDPLQMGSMITPPAKSANATDAPGTGGPLSAGTGSPIGTATTSPAEAATANSTGSAPTSPTGPASMDPAAGLASANPAAGAASLVPETSVPTQTPTGDDDFEEENNEYGGGDEYGGEGEWGGEPLQEEGTKAPYVPPTGDDPFAKPPDESEWTSEEWPQETPEQMMHDKNVTIAVVAAVVFGFVLALFSAQQVIENPDGCCASICRCNVKFFCFFFKILCFPCRMCCGSKDRRSHDLMVGSSDSYTHDLELT